MYGFPILELGKADGFENLSALFHLLPEVAIEIGDFESDFLVCLEGETDLFMSNLLCERRFLACVTGLRYSANSFGPKLTA